MRQGAITRRLLRAAAAGAALTAGVALATLPGTAWATGGGRAGGDAGAGHGGDRGTAPATAGRLRDDLLGRASFPAGWTSSPNPVAGDSQLLDPHRLAGCAGVAARRVPARPPATTGPEFDLASSGLSVGEQVQAYPTTADATAAVDVIGAPRAPTCATAALDRSGSGTAAGGASEGRYSVTRLAVPGEDAQTAALAVTLALEEHGRAASTTVDDVVVRSGRTVATVTLTALGRPFPVPLARHLVAEAAARIAR